MLKDEVDIPGVDLEIIPDLQEERGNLMVLALEVALVVVQDHVIGFPDDHAPTVMKRPGIDELIGDLTHGQGRILGKKGVAIDHGRVLGSDITE
jgi:hypothetical protein